MSGVTLWNTRGWFVLNTENVPIIYLSIVDEGITTHPSDTPANVQFRPRIKNMMGFSVKRAPKVWVWGDTSVQAAAFGKLVIDNYDGAFDFFMLNDLRDAQIIMQLPPALMLGGAATMASAPIVATAILDDSSMDSEDEITVTLKDTIARLDRPLLMPFNPPFVDSGAARRMMPLSLGALRNLPPQLIDTPNRIFRLGDTAMSNVTAARDKGAPLDVHASPPQYAPALNGAGICPQVMPVGVFTVDCSSEGAQAQIPGIADILNGVGRLRSTTNPGPDGPGVNTWTGTASPSTTPPSGWSYDNLANGTISRLSFANGMDQDWAMMLSTSVPFTPGTTGQQGISAHLASNCFVPGQTYRISINVRSVYIPAGARGGLILRTDLGAGMAGAISGGYQDQSAIIAPNPNGAPYSFIWQCPNDNVARSLYVIMSGDTHFATPCQAQWDNVTIELLGTYTELPLVGISIGKYFQEILALRAGESTSVWNAADLTALQAATVDQTRGTTGYVFGNHYEDQPNILTALRDPLDSYGATLFTDNLGILRVARIIDPTDPLGPAIVADFDSTNVQRPISIRSDRAIGLTTLIGARRNWKVFNPTDFVTDFTLVPADVRYRYEQLSQYQLLANVNPAGQYSFAQGAGVFDSLLDDPIDAQNEINRIIALYAPKVYSDGTVFNGRRRFVTFTVFFDDVTQVGVNTKTNAATLKFGDIIKLTYLRHGFNNTRLMVAATEIFPFAQKIVITGWY